MSRLKVYGTFGDDIAVEFPETRLGSGRVRCRNAVLIFVSVCSALLSYAMWRNLPFLICYLGLFNPSFGTKSWNDFKNQSFAVGFDLTAGYGTSAVTFDNGTITNVARVEGSLEYNEVLARLSVRSSAHSTPPYYNCSAQISDLPRQWNRYFRKRLGWAPSSDVAALATVLSKLKDSTNTFLKPFGPVEIAFITTPYLPALYNEELLDAADHAGVQLLTLPGSILRSGDQAQWPVSEINSAMAGNGLGVDNLFSQEVKDSHHRKRSNGNANSLMLDGAWSDNILSVLFTKDALTAHVSPIVFAPHFYFASGIVNFTLGLPTPPPLPSHPYWLEIRSALRAAMDSYQGRGNALGRVISYGDGADNDVFVEVLKETVLEAQESNESEKQPEFWKREPLFAGSRGAAIFASYCKRLPDYLSCFPDLKPKMQGW